MRRCRRTAIPDAGRLPYCHVETDNQASMALQRKLGLTIDEQPLYWVG